MSPSCDGSNCGACACEVRYVDKHEDESQSLIDMLKEKIDLLEEELEVKYADVLKKKKEKKERMEYERLKKKFE